MIIIKHESRQKTRSRVGGFFKWNIWRHKDRVFFCCLISLVVFVLSIFSARYYVR